MCEHFGVGPQLLEDVDDIFPRFLCWLPKYHLSMPPKRSLQAWQMVIDSLDADEVSSFFGEVWFGFCFSLCLGMASLHFEFFVIFFWALSNI